MAISNLNNIQTAADSIARESASRGIAQDKAIAKSICDLLIHGQTVGKESNNRSESIDCLVIAYELQ